MSKDVLSKITPRFLKVELEAKVKLSKEILLLDNLFFCFFVVVWAKYHNFSYV